MRDDRPLLDRILDTPQLAQVVPRLAPELLHRVIERVGLEDSGELVALATPEQLRRVFDRDLWRAGRAGRDEQFDPERFAVWLEVMLDAGVAAEKLAAMDLDLVVAAFAAHARVFDLAATRITVDDEDVAAIRLDVERSCEIGGYLVACRGDARSWHPVADTLRALDAEHPEAFRRIMRGCRRLSDSLPELDEISDRLSAGDQAMFDLGADRDARLAGRGFVPPANARAFLQAARRFRVGGDAAASSDPLVRAYFESIDSASDVDEDAASRSASDPPRDTTPADEASVASLVEVLQDAGIAAAPPRALLQSSQADAPRFGELQAHLEALLALDFAAYSRRTEELAYLANTIAAGCGIFDRPLTPAEASDAVAAVCNLALQSSPAVPPRQRAWLAGETLVTVFQAGWTLLYEEVCMAAAGRLIATLDRLRCADDHIQRGLDDLRRAMLRQWQAGTPWRAREALDVLTAIDLPAWAALLALLDECPVMHAAIGGAHGPPRTTIDPTAFEFISDRRQLAAINEFLDSLPATLAG